MAKKFKIVAVIVILIISCSRSRGVDSLDGSSTATFSVILGSSYNDDINSINNDDKFSSLILLIFDSNDNLESVEAIESLSPTSITEVEIETSLGDKTIYAIANYRDQIFKDSSQSEIELDQTVTKEQLERLTVESSDGLVADNLVMVGVEEFTVSKEQLYVDIPLERLAARVDLHIFKDSSFDESCDDIIATKVTLYNSVYSGNLITLNQMPAEPIYCNQTIHLDRILDYYDCDSDIEPSVAMVSLYSYTNISDILSSISAYIEIELDDEGVSSIYKGYIYCESQQDNSYSLLANNVYQITAILMPNYELALSFKIRKWRSDGSDIYLE